MLTTRRSWRAVAAALITLSVLLVAAPADADDHLEIIAEDLDNPRGVAVKGGRIYVAQAGRGGDQLVAVPQGGGPGPVCVGATGSIAEIVGGVAVPQVVLPSVTDAVDGSCTGPGTGFAATGPHGIDVQGRQFHYTIGLGGTPATRAALAAAEPTAESFGLLVDQRNRRLFERDLAGFEDATDPNGDGSDSNPYGLLRGPSGSAVVVDAGANALLEVRRSGTVNVIATFAPRCVPWPFGPNPIPPAFNPCGDPTLFPSDAVPTDVAIHEDGDYLVSMLGGFPFTPGAARVFKIDRDHGSTASCSTFPAVPAAGCEVFADGLTALVGIDVANDGNVYVVQVSDAGILALSPVAPGSVQVLDPDTGDVVGSIDGLTAPGGIDIHKGEAYITNRSISPGDGQLLMSTLVHPPRR